jgi:hypothetical protein
MPKKLTKLQAERRVFDFLAPLVGLRVLSNSIIQGDPPSPDVECQLKGGDGLAVELIALDAGDTRERLGNMNATDEPGSGRWRLGGKQTKQGVCRSSRYVPRNSNPRGRGHACSHEY